MPLAELTTDTVGRVVVARLDGEIDMSNAGEIGDALNRHVVNDSLGLVVDLTEVVYLDSAAIQVIFELREGLRTRGQLIRLVVVPGSAAADTLRVAGVPAAIGVDETVAAAMRKISA
ncbi:MAG TPA: STAS domain-containing protein [Solirubrobacteraceae bacterium]